MQPTVRYVSALCLTAFLLLYSASTKTDLLKRLYDGDGDRGSARTPNRPRTHPFNCRDIIDGKILEMRKAERWVLDQPSGNSSSCLSLPSLMPKGRDSESSFPLAFSIIAYKNPNQLRRLLRVLYRPWNSYCIHLDQKSDQATVELVSTLIKCHENIWMSEDRYDVRWGEPSLLYAAVGCQRLLYSKSESWVYLLNIAASDFPLMPNSDMVQALISLNGSSDVQVTSVSRDGWKYKYSFANDKGPQAAIEQLKAALVTNQSFPIKAPPPFGLKIKKGSFSAALHREFVKFLITDNVAKTFLHYLNDTFIADEAYWSTLYHGHFTRLRPSTNTSARFRTRYTHWGSYRPSCRGYYEHGLCVFGVRDLKWLLKKADGYFFAHKFDETVQPVALECLEEYIFNKTYPRPYWECFSTGALPPAERF